MSNSSHGACIAFLSSLSSFEGFDHFNGSHGGHSNDGFQTRGHSQFDFQFDVCMWFAKTVVDGRYYLTACAIVLFLDIILTLDVEIERVWNTKFTKAKLLFYLNRYLPPILYSIALFGSNHPSLSSKFCTNFFQEILPVLIVFGEAAIGALLILRTRALYQETKGHLSYVVQGVLIIVYLVQIALSVLVAKDLKAYFTPQKHIGRILATLCTVGFLLMSCNGSEGYEFGNASFIRNGIALIGSQTTCDPHIPLFPPSPGRGWKNDQNGMVDENTCHPRPAIIIRIDARPIGSPSSLSEECMEYVDRDYSYSPTCYNRNKPLPDIEQGCESDDLVAYQKAFDCRCSGQLKKYWRGRDVPRYLCVLVVLAAVTSSYPWKRISVLDESPGLVLGLFLQKHLASVFVVGVGGIR
ncbi:uncharacterized protein FOMMEDRAFT_149413 [Fomitiporia mediterranea MF3/22]|uniref:uncharacterized protein n=1 Tax=Fomitiporia mediterranea (strain MF3/22) TaxID=694068 RepID=UPI0004409585|nr:uncharacterized protein FOMMEDRAFT_149413 [Fomitiporia mediterranea MF3/22]EJC97948.1 hypothetical protein FOMMEDRAFT_149413 [Fomitiporia mediterranea MF3/22]